MLPEQWRVELARGHDPSALAFAMIERGLMAGEGGKSSVVMKVYGRGIRTYRILPKIFE